MYVCMLNLGKPFCESTLIRKLLSDVRRAMMLFPSSEPSRFAKSARWDVIVVEDQQVDLKLGSRRSKIVGVIFI